MLDITGFTLGEALKRIKEAGIADTVVKLTSPPRHADAEYNDSSRVVKQSLNAVNGALELIVCNAGEVFV